MPPTGSINRRNSALLLRGTKRRAAQLGLLPCPVKSQTWRRIAQDTNETAQMPEKADSLEKVCALGYALDRDHPKAFPQGSSKASPRRIGKTCPPPGRSIAGILPCCCEEKSGVPLSWGQSPALLSRSMASSRTGYQRDR